MTRVLGARPGPAEYEYRCDGEKCAATVRGAWTRGSGWTYNAKLHLDFCPDCTVKLAAERGEQERLF